VAFVSAAKAFVAIAVMAAKMIAGISLVMMSSSRAQTREILRE
jgi:hypothetical protein